MRACVCSIGRYVVCMLLEAAILFTLVLAVELNIFRRIALLFGGSSAVCLHVCLSICLSGVVRV